MVIDDLYLHVIPHPFDRHYSLRVDQDHVCHTPPRHIIHMDHGHVCAIQGQKMAYVAIDVSRQNRNGLRIELGCAQQGRNAVKICVLMGQDRAQVGQRHGRAPSTTRPGSVARSQVTSLVRM